MNSRFLIDVVLAISSLVLGVYLTATQNTPTASEFAERKDNVLKIFRPEEIQEIRLSGKAGAAAVLRRDTTGSDTSRFFLGEQGTTLADEAAIGELISALDYAVFKRRLGAADGLDEAQLGFTAPVLEVRILAGPRSYRMLFGKAAPAPAQTIYIRVEGDNIDSVTGVVSESLLQKLSRGEQEFRGGLLFPYSRSETQTLTLSRGEQKVILEADGAGFLLNRDARGEPKVRADRTLTDLIFFQLARASIETYVSGTNEVSVPSDAILITQEGPSGATYSARIGGACPGGSNDLVFATRLAPDKVSGCISRTVAPALRVDQARLVDRTATLFMPDEIDHAIVKVGSRTLDLIRNESGYQLLSRDGAAIPADSGDDFLTTLAESRLLPLSEPPLKSTQKGDITLRGQIPTTAATSASGGQSDRSQELRLRLFSDEPSGQVTRLKREDDGAWFDIPEEVRWAFSGEDGWARERTLTDFPKEEIEKVVITTEGGVRQEVTRDGMAFRLSQPEEEADTSLAQEVFSTLAHLEAHRFLTPSVPRPDAGLTTVEFFRRSKGEDRVSHETLWIGARARGGYLAWSTATDGTFTVPLGLRDLLSTPLLSRAPVRVIQTEVDALTITAQNRVFAFERQAGMMRAVGGEATGDMIEPLTQALDVLDILSAVPAQKPARNARPSTPEFSFQGRREAESGEPMSFTVHIGGEAVWQGQSASLVWLEGHSESYFVSQASLRMLRDLL